MEQGCSLHDLQVRALCLGDLRGQADDALHVVEAMHRVIGIPGTGLLEGGHMRAIELTLGGLSKKCKTINNRYL